MKSKFQMDGAIFLDDFIALAEKSKNIKIATFGLYAGRDNLHPVAQFLDYLPPAKIMVGTPFFSSCLHGCVDCIQKYNERLDFLTKTTLRFKKHTFLIRDRVHIKIFLALIGKRWQGYAGSRNLTGSGWGDVMVRLDSYDACGLSFEFDKLWNI